MISYCWRSRRSLENRYKMTIASFLVFVRAKNSDSVLESVTVVCLLACQAIGVSNSLMRKPWDDLWSLWLAKEMFMKTSNVSSVWFLLKRSLYVFVVLKY